MDAPNTFLPDRFAKCDTSVNINPAELPPELLYAVTQSGGRCNLMIYSYLRCSSPKQLRGDSVRRQVELRDRVCWKYGLSLVPDGDYRDLGVSAFRGRNQILGALSLFLNGCKSGKIKRGAVLLVESLDRISRQHIRKALRLFLEIIDEYGVTIWTLSADQRIYSPQSDKSDLEEILISICIMSRAHEENALKRERIMERRAVRMAEAMKTGKPFCKRTWYWLEIKKRKDGTEYYHPISERVKEVQLIFKLAAKGWGAQRILRFFRAKGIKSWTQSHVLRTLRNPAVLGVWQPYRNENGRKMPDGEPREKYYPRIIDQSVWDQVQIIQDAKILKNKMVTDRKALSNYPNNGGVLPGISGVPALLPGFGNGRLSELSLFTTSILLDESDNDSRTMYLVCNHQKNGKVIPYLATHQNKGEEANYIRYDFVEAAFFHFFPMLDWEKIASQTEPKEAEEWKDKLAPVLEKIYSAEQRDARNTQLLANNASLTESLTFIKESDAAKALLKELYSQRDFMLAKIAALKQGGRMFENIPQFKKLVEKSTTDLTNGVPIPPDVRKARQDLKNDIHHKISMISFKFMKTQEGPAADIRITFANGVVRLMTLFCESLRGFLFEPDGTRTYNFDFDPDRMKARGRRCFTLKFKEGWTLDQIAAELHMNRITVHKTLRGKIRPYLYSEWFGHWPDGKISDHYLSDEERAEILKYHEQGLSFLEIACKTGRNRRSVSNTIMAAGVPHFNRRNGVKPRFVSGKSELR